jgi:hypothetical protein
LSFDIPLCHPPCVMALDLHSSWLCSWGRCLVTRACLHAHVRASRDSCCTVLSPAAGVLCSMYGAVCHPLLAGESQHALSGVRSQRLVCSQRGGCCCCASAKYPLSMQCPDDAACAVRELRSVVWVFAALQQLLSWSTTCCHHTGRMRSALHAGSCDACSLAVHAMA